MASEKLRLPFTRERQMETIEQLAVVAKENQEIRAQMIEECEKYILRSACRTVKRYVCKSDDEWSVAMLAFSQAIDTYDPRKGSFLPYASLIIARRLNDHYRKSIKYAQEVAVPPYVFEGDAEEDEYSPVYEAVRHSMAEQQHFSLKDEIEAIGSVFAAYGFSFYDLAACSPKSRKTRKECARAVRVLLDSQLLLGEMRLKKLLPVKIIVEETKLPRKNCGEVSKIYNSSGGNTVAGLSRAGRIYPVYPGGGGQMKALVVEIRRRKAAVLLDDGRVILVPDKNYAAGQELELHSARNMRKRTVAWAASAAAAILIFVGALLYMAPYYYVSLDVNPSIEFSVNRLDQVLEVNAVNSDAQGIVSEMNGTDHIPVEQAVNLAMKVLSSKHYFDGKERRTYCFLLLLLIRSRRNSLQLC